MSENGLRLYRRIPNWMAPIILIGAFLIQPYVSDWNDEDVVTREVAAASTRELTASVLGVLYCAVAVLAVFAVVGFLRRTAGERWALVAAPSLTFGFVLLAAHFALFVARALVIRNGVSTTTGFGDELYTDMTGIIGGILLVLGFFALVAGARRGGLLTTSQGWIVMAGTLVAFVGAGLDPGWADWVAAAGTAAIFWTFAFALTTKAEAVIEPTDLTKLAAVTVTSRGVKTPA
jgi:hypothetical protein